MKKGAKQIVKKVRVHKPNSFWGMVGVKEEVTDGCWGRREGEGERPFLQGI